MSELSKSNDPRVRRSHAHAMLHKLSRGEVDREEVEAAIARADQTRKGRASDFASRLVKADREGRFHNRPTANQDIEIITLVTGPDGEQVPLVLGAGSWEDFDKAWEEGDEVVAAASDAPDAPNPEVVRGNHILKRLAETGGTMPQIMFYRGVQIARERQAE